VDHPGSILSPCPVVRCGSKEAPLESFVRLYQAWIQYFLSDPPRFAFGRPFDNVPFSVQMSLWTETSQRLEKGEGDALIGWLMCAHQHEAKLPRDKIYALLGMCHAADRAAIKPNYEQTQTTTSLNQLFCGLRYQALLFQRKLNANLRFSVLDNAGNEAPDQPRTTRTPNQFHSANQIVRSSRRRPHTAFATPVLCFPYK
jgi:hypothetical protein